MSESALTGQIYIKEYLQKRPLPLIESHDKGSVFQPDLSSTHYVKLALERYEKHNVDAVPKAANLSFCPVLRVIK